MRTTITLGSLLALCGCAAPSRPAVVPAARGSILPRCEVGTPVQRTLATPAMGTLAGARFAAQPDGAFPACPAFSGTTGAGPWTTRFVAHSSPAATQPWARMLSSLYWNRRQGAFYAVQDNDPHLVRLTPSADLSSWEGSFVPAHFGIHTGLEGLAMLGDRWLVGDDGHDQPERAHLVAIDASGALVAPPVTVPPELERMSFNSGFEAVGVTPDEQAVMLSQERPGLDAQGNCRANPLLVRLPVTGGAQFFAYPLERAGGGRDVGLSELVALSPTLLLTLERGFTSGVGNAVRIYLTTLLEGGSAEAPGAVHKTLVADLGTMPLEAFGSAMPFGQTMHPGLGNYEGMTLGPCLSSGERSLVLLTDDNADNDHSHGGQARHLTVLALSDRATAR